MRFKVASWGRQSGKTTHGLHAMLKRPLAGRPEGVYWYILQTHATAEIAFRRYLRLLRDTPFMTGWNLTDKRVTLVGGREVSFKSGENFQDLRTETLDGTIIDEYRQQHPELWSMVIRPMLARQKGWAEFLSTANGYDHFYDLAEAARNDQNGEWSFHHAPSTEAPWWTAEEVESARRTMSEAEFDQEIMSNFRDLTSGKVYISHGTWNQITHTPFLTSDPERQVSDRLPIVLGLDFNLSPMSWHLGQCDRLKWYWFDEIHLENSHTQEAAGLLIEKLCALRSRGLMRASPHLTVIGDATGKAGQRAAAGKSDYDIVLGALKEYSFTYDNATPDANPAIKDRINNMNAKLKAADGSSSFFYNPIACPALKKDLDRVVWKNGVLDEGKKKELTHASDSVGYPVNILTPMKSMVEVGIPRIVVL